jgi:hypothetical protein
LLNKVRRLFAGNVAELMFTAGYVALLAGLSAQFGPGWAAIVGGLLLMTIAIYPYLLRLR